MHTQIHKHIYTYIYKYEQSWLCTVWCQLEVMHMGTVQSKDCLYEHVQVTGNENQQDENSIKKVPCSSSWFQCL